MTVSCSIDDLGNSATLIFAYAEDGAQLNLKNQADIPVFSKELNQRMAMLTLPLKIHEAGLYTLTIKGESVDYCRQIEVK